MTKFYLRSYRSAIWLGAALTAILSAPAAHAQVPTTLDDFFLPGTQPDESDGEDFQPILHSQGCRLCHGVDAPSTVPIYSRWAGSMMAQAMRDPLFHACLAVANQDADFAGDLCIRCHAPAGWLGGRSVPTDGSELTFADHDGVTCNFCHRLVDPVFDAETNPPGDAVILDALAAAGALPTQYGNAGYVVDPVDVRRGPFDDVPLNVHGADVGIFIVPSAFHRSSDLCGTCHDVSNPVFARQEDGSYLPNELGVAHASQDKHDMFPLERTYSEWANSLWATVGVDSGGAFGGNHPTGVMRTCQDCHMPDTQARGCTLGSPFFQRNDVPSHEFNGGSTWILDAISNLFPWDVFPTFIQQSQDRARNMLEKAATLEVTASGCSISVRVVNETAHKLPTGYPEGRRLWITVQFQDAGLQLVAVRGAYDPVEADLTDTDTKVYEAHLGLDETMAEIAGLEPGPSFHFALNNKYFKDNRIPPRGFTNAAFEAVRAAPVGATYADGQYWDDTLFRIPPGAVRAIVTLNYQSSSKDYITFLRDENHTNDAGDVLYEQWELANRGPPVEMARITLADLSAGIFGDADCDGDVDLNDVAALPDCLTGPGRTLLHGCAVMDRDLDGEISLADVQAVLNAFAIP